MEFILGFFGAFCTMAAFAAGWLCRGRYGKSNLAEPASEAESRRIKEAQRAFQQIQNYTVEDAYGMNRGVERP